MSRLMVFALAVMLLPLGGCFEHIASINKHTFKSTPLQPTTITLVDTSTHEEFWKMDVPVCTRLVMDFDRPPEMESIYNNVNPASILNWKLLPLDGNDPIDKGTCYLSGCRPFLMKVTYRDSPELPDADPGMLRNCPDCVQRPHATAAMPQGQFAAPAMAASPAPAPAPMTVQAPVVQAAAEPIQQPVWQPVAPAQGYQQAAAANYQPLPRVEVIEQPQLNY